MRTRRLTAGDVRRQQWVWSDVERRGQLTEEYGSNREVEYGMRYGLMLAEEGRDDRRRTERELVQLIVGKRARQKNKRRMGMEA